MFRFNAHGELVKPCYRGSQNLKLKFAHNTGHRQNCENWLKTITDVKKFWDSRPCNLYHSDKEVGTKEYFREVEYKKHFVEPHILSFADFKKWTGKKVLEIGCGLGSETENFARAGAKVTVIELSEKSLELAKKRIELFGMSDQVKFYQGNAEELTILFRCKSLI